jgi:methyl acetate hydrolase
MQDQLRPAADAILQGAAAGSPGVPGVVAMATDRHGNVYEGAAGKRMAGAPEPMTTDSVFAIFSTTKAITGTAILQLVEAGQLDLDAPAGTYAPELVRVQVLDGFDADGQPRLRAPKRPVTTRMLLLHTAGFGYAFFNTQYSTSG